MCGLHFTRCRYNFICLLVSAYILIEYNNISLIQACQNLCEKGLLQNRILKPNKLVD